MRNITLTRQTWPLGSSDAVTMPMVPSTRVPSAVRLMPCAAFAAADISAPTRLRGTGVAGYGHVTGLGDVVAQGAFPGLTAWSPPT